MTDRFSGSVVLATVVFALCGCADERSGKSKGTEITEVAKQPADTIKSSTSDMAGSGAADNSSPAAGSDNPAAPVEDCRAVDAPEHIPARVQAFMFDGGESQRAVFVRDVFGIFKTHCGGCHVDTNLGDFQIKEAAVFSDEAMPQQQKILDSLMSDDPKQFMPPPEAGGIKWSDRKEGDPIRELVSLLTTWFAADLPSDLFYLPTEQVDKPGYRLTEDVAQSLTNMGNCVPSKAIVYKEEAKMNDLDAFFAGLDGQKQGLPDRLSKTDLVTYDSEELAKLGVFSYVPTYPLFSDDAKKMRHVRVPRGQTLAFDKDSQQFSVPANTRLYKTFLKKIIDADGNERFKKIETRRIVSRPDGPDAPNGDHETHALFGTYMWNDSETEAFLVTDPLRNGKPFRDRLITYFTDEARAQAVLAQDPLDKVVALQESGAVRSYAIPGSDRCIQCHEGSTSHSFVLGLTTLQLMSRKKGTGGVIEDTGADEINQLQRFIDYKVVSGIHTLDDVTPLELSQFSRAPRNDHELQAQGYMLGNCAFCHNPRGFPTIRNPELKPLLNMYPSREGGIFQFPLDRVSPRIRRGISQDVDIPYITPSLLDYTPEPPAPYVSKWIQDGKNGMYLAAPWRSLIYRNVDSPFPYSEDYALYPHMPMNSSGYDCRGPAIFGDWMVSIPAKRRNPTVPETQDATPQPYVEVKPSDKDYATAATAADARLKAYHGNFTKLDQDEFTKKKYAPYLVGYRSTMYCPDTSDIVDPNVKGAVQVPGDVPGSSLPSLGRQIRLGEVNPTDLVEAVSRFASTSDGVPDMPHWVVTDITDPPGDWNPRRTDWDKVLVTHEKTDLDPVQARAVSLLQTRTLTDAFRKFVSDPHPYTTWTDKPECDLSAQPRINSFTGGNRPRWMDRAYLDHPAPMPTDHVYSQSWSAAIYNEICVNCHGPDFDSRGRQADTLMIMTGGDTRVANFKNGFFGPPDKPHSNVVRVFGPHTSGTLQPDDLAARYTAWMGLGGTQRVIPPVIMNVVATVEVFGEKRPGNLDLTASGANMLSIAKTLCEHSLGFRRGAAASFNLDKGELAYREPNLGELGVALLDVNADAQMWLELCSFDNPPPIRVVRPRQDAWQEFDQISKPVTYYIWGGNEEAPLSWYKPDTYPANAIVGNHLGDALQGLRPNNLFPWCLQPPTADDQKIVDKYVDTKRMGNPFPICNASWITNEANRMTLEEIEQWTTRGAINAGFAVYAYLNDLSKAVSAGGAPQPAFNRCELIKH